MTTRLNSVVVWAESREDLVRFTKLALDCKLYDKAFMFLSKMIYLDLHFDKRVKLVQPTDLTEEEQDLFLEAYQGKLQSLLHPWEIIQKKVTENNDLLNDEGFIMFKAATVEDIMKSCTQKFQMLDIPLRLASISDSSRAFYCTLTADCHWQISKVALHSFQIEEARFYAISYYTKAQELIEKLENSQAEEVVLSDALTSNLLNRLKKIKSKEQCEKAVSSEMQNANIKDEDAGKERKQEEWERQKKYMLHILE